MVKSFLILISLQIFLFSSEQILLVVSNNINSTKAKLSCFEGNKEVFKEIDVNLGKKGLALGIGVIPIKNTKKYPLKYEGDNKSPIGIFKLTKIFGYKKASNFKMPYLYADKKLICIDAPKDKNYNKILQMSKIKPKSFEYMRRDDIQYKIGIVVEHNKKQIKQRGSCIFIHVQKKKNSPTSGCTSMSFSDLNKITKWLDIEKNPILIQIQKSSLTEIYKLYPQLKP